MPDISVIQQFLTPPLSFMSRELIPGVFSGSGVLTRPRGPIAVDAFGVMFEFFTVPPGYGFQLGSVKQYDVRMIQLAAIHNMIDGHGVVSQLENFNQDNTPFIFANAFPQEVQYSVAPGVVVVFHWLLVF